MVAALCIPAMLSAGSEPAVLPAGSPLTVVCDQAIDPKTARPGYLFRAHLQTALTLGTTVLATAGSPVGILIVDVVRGLDPAVRFNFQHFSVPAAAAVLPIVPLSPTMPGATAGTVIPARTAGDVIVEGDRTMVRVPLPFGISGDAPNASFTPLPYRTTAPVEPPRRRPTPSPAPSASPSEPLTTPLP